MEKICKKDLADSVAAGLSGYSREEIRKIVRLTFDSLAECIVSGRPVSIAGFGEFSLRRREERNGVNPQTGEKLTVPACNTVHFRSFKSLKDAVNGRQG